MKCVRIIISGTVQNVGFRRWFARKARKLGVVGWVKNNPEGMVEAYCVGDAEAIERLITFAHQGPPLAQVAEVHVAQLNGDHSFTDFRVVH